MGDAAAADWYAERDVSLPVSLESESSSAIWAGLVDRVPERDDWILDVAECVGRYVWFVTVDHLRGEIGVVMQPSAFPWYTNY